MDIDSDIIEILAKLHNKFKFGLTDIQFIIEIFQTFIKKSFYTFLLQNLESRLFNVVDSEVSNEIILILRKSTKVFDKYNSENKRLNIYKLMGLYVQPEVNVLNESLCTRSRKNKTAQKKNSVHSVHMSLKHSLTQML